MNVKTDIDLKKLSVQLIPHFLKLLGTGLSWVTQSGISWVTDNGLSWTVEGESRQIDWIRSLIQPIQQLNDKVKQYTDDVYYRLNLTGQVIYLEHYLNDLFDKDQRRIYLSDDNLVLPPYLFNKSDGEAVLNLYNEADGETPFHLYNKQDYFNQGSFVINVPAAIILTQSMLNRIKRATNQYKQAGVSYSIVNY